MGLWADTFGGGNSFTESVANVLTPKDGTRYEGGTLVNESTGATVSGSNSIGQTVANYLTPRDGTVYQGGTLINQSTGQVVESDGAFLTRILNGGAVTGTRTTASTSSGGGSSSASTAATTEETPTEEEEVDNVEAATDRMKRILEAAGIEASTENMEAIVADPNKFLADRGMKLSDLVTLLDGNAEGTTLDPNDPRYSTSGDVTYDATATTTATVNAPGQAPVETIKTASAVDRINSGAYDVNAVTGTVKDEALVNAEDYTIDMTGAATGVNADGTVNATGVALNDYASVNTSRIIDTSTVAGRLLADKLGEGNYVDSKATVLGMMKIISEEFKGPNGEPVIPSWAASINRNISRTIAFSGMSGSAAVAASANAIMEASLGVAETDADFFKTLTIKNLDNRQEAIINKANVLAKFDLANMSAREAAAIENAKTFLTYDLKNLDNKQQAEVINKQARIDAMFTATAEENVNRRLNIQNELETRKFYDRLALEADTFNASAINATREANANRADAASRFNIERTMARDQYESTMAYNIDVSNANWRRTVETTNTSMIFEAASTDVRNSLGLTTETLNKIWDRVDAILDYTWRSVEADEQRDYDLLIAELQAAGAAADAKAKSGGSLLGAVVSGIATVIAASDIRLKDDIELFDTLSNGIKLYTWKWNDEAKRIGADQYPGFGVIAQEIQKTHPDAVVEGEHGYLIVNYGKVLK